MLRLLMEQRSEDDLKLVMKWIEQQRNQQLREEVDKMLGTQLTRVTSTTVQILTQKALLGVGAAVPSDWEEGRHFSFAYAFDNATQHSFRAGEYICVYMCINVYIRGYMCPHTTKCTTMCVVIVLTLCMCAHTMYVSS